MKTIEELKADVTAAERLVVVMKDALEEAIAAVNNNVYTNLEDACSIIEERLQDKAHDACEGSYSCGLEQYSQLFIVGGQTYKATLSVDYNRHDKTYYYVDGSRFSYESVEVENDLT